MAVRFGCLTVVLGLLAVACQNRRATPIGGDWAIEQVTSLAPEPGQMRGDLVFRRGREREVVDRYVWKVHYFAPQCVGYQRSRTGEVETLFVCGEHRPLLLARETNPDAWVLDASGIRKTTERTVIDGRLIESGIGFTADRLREFAVRTPPRSTEYVALDIRAKAQPFNYDAAKDLERRDHNGATSLMNALADYKSEEAKALIRAGANVNARDRIGYTPLHLCSGAELAKMLIEAGADVNARADDGATPLIAAASDNRREVVRVLLEAGADWRLTQRVRLADPDVPKRFRDVEMTPLAYAIERHHAEIEKMLRDAGARR